MEIGEIESLKYLVEKLGNDEDMDFVLNLFKKKSTLRVRELHVYGSLTSSGSGQSQHKGIGKFLLKIGEYIAYYHKLEQVAIIAGVGVQDYYGNLGYTEKEEYMIKNIKNKPSNIF